MAKKHYMQILLETCSMVEMVVESLEYVVNSPNDILSTIEGDSGIIDCIKHSGTKAFFQNIPTDLQTEVIEAVGFVLESAKEAKYLKYGRKLEIEGMLGSPKRITLASVREMYEIGLTKFLFFIQIYFSQIFQINKEEIEGLSDKEKNTIAEALETIKDCDLLKQKQEEYSKVTMESYLNIKFCTAEDDIAEELGLTSSEELSAEIGSFSDDLFIEG